MGGIQRASGSVFSASAHGSQRTAIDPGLDTDTRRTAMLEGTASFVFSSERCCGWNRRIPKAGAAKPHTLLHALSVGGRRASNDATTAQRCQALGGPADRTQHFIGVLTQKGWRASVLNRRQRKLHRAGHQLQRVGQWVR